MTELSTPLHPLAAGTHRHRHDSGAAVDFNLDVPADCRQQLAMAWFGLGLLALLASGLFSLLLVISRTPQLHALFPVADFFRVALVVHVDLSVLVWFLAFGAGLWTLSGTTRLARAGWLAFALSAIGTLAMCASPFVERANAVMANYVPVLDGPIFLAGLTMFGGGICVLCLRSMLAVTPVGMRISGQGALRFGLNASLVATAVAAFSFGWSWVAVPRELDARIYYELVFWGGGHVLQFAYTLLMLVAWVWLASSLRSQPVASLRGRPDFPLSPRVLTLLFAIALLAVFLTPMTYLAYDVTSVEHHRAQTLLMRVGGGIVIPPIGVAVIWTLLSGKNIPANSGPIRSSLVASLALFAAGGVIGLMITGSNVRIPAHYHGCIVGITLAMMGVVYLLLPRFGFAAPVSSHATWQPVVYGTGQLMHIVGLVWSGGYGVQRKVAGAEQVLRTPAEMAGMGLMGLGGLIAIVGGIMFVVIVLRALGNRREIDS
jgi:cytochrome c oxidase subunit I